jgi:pilus assembly protein TadC
MVEKKKLQGFTFFQKYKRMLKQIKFKMPAAAWLILSVGLSLAVAAVSFVTITVLALPISPIVAFVLFLVVIDLMLGYPYVLAMRRINSIEENLPEALKQLADTLKAGGTYEYALREISNAEYGHLSKEMENVLRKMEEGENIEDSLDSLTTNIDSILVKRTIAIINDAIKAGAGLAEVLEEIADDVRSLHRIGKERVAGTMLQVIFIVAAGSLVAPAILGMVSTVIQLLIETAASLSASHTAVVETLWARDMIVMLMQIYLIIEVVASGAMIAITREGKLSKSLIYIPMLLLVAFVCYYAALFGSGVFIGGMR